MGGSGAGTHRLLRLVPFSAAGKLKGLLNIDFLCPYDNFPVLAGTDLCLSGDHSQAFRKAMGYHPSYVSIQLLLQNRGRN